jgi:O-methyltransferase involved in polyketide biosynthesis
MTAIGIAILRGIESEKPASERLCYDPYACRFVNAALYNLIRLFDKIGYSERKGPGVTGFLAVRERHIDEFLQQNLAEGVQQVIILGAGLDARAYRFEGLRTIRVAVDSILAFIASRSAAGSAVIFDYMYPTLLDGMVKRGEVANMRSRRWASGEALVFGIPEGTVTEFLELRGFTDVQDADHEFLRATYLTGPNAARTIAYGYAIASAVVKAH